MCENCTLFGPACETGQKIIERLRLATAIHAMAQAADDYSKHMKETSYGTGTHTTTQRAGQPERRG